MQINCNKYTNDQVILFIEFFYIKLLNVTYVAQEFNLSKFRQFFFFFYKKFSFILLKNKCYLLNLMNKLYIFSAIQVNLVWKYQK
jgi:hypothetical protein